MAKTLAAAVSPLIKLHEDISTQLASMEDEYQTRRAKHLKATEEYDAFVLGMEALHKTKSYLEAVPEVRATLPEPVPVPPEPIVTGAKTDVAQPSETPVPSTPSTASVARQTRRKAHA